MYSIPFQDPYSQQPQQQAGPMGASPMAQAQGQPLMGAQDPKSQYLAAALSALQKTPSQGSPMGLGANLLADALDQYALKRQQDQLSGQGHVNFTNPTVQLDPSQLPQANLQARQFMPNIINGGGL